jgi:hypothetical protein
MSCEATASFKLPDDDRFGCALEPRAGITGGAVAVDVNDPQLVDVIARAWATQSMLVVIGADVLEVEVAATAIAGALRWRRMPFTGRPPNTTMH